MPLFKKRKAQVDRPDAGDAITDCPQGGEGCSAVQRHETELRDIDVGLNTLGDTVRSFQERIDEKLETADSTVGSFQRQIDEKVKEVDLAVESFRKQIDEKLKKVDSVVASFQKEIEEQKNKDREYTWARTCQVGLLTIKEAHRIHEVIGRAPRTSVGAVNFDVYGIDKYYGMVYGDCISKIWNIKEDCRDYDRKLASGDEELAQAAATQIEEDAIAIMAAVYAFLRQVFQKIQRLDVRKYHDEESEEMIRECFRTYTNVMEINTEEIQEMMEFFRKIIHDIVDAKTN